jgi:hypothetical protein
MSAEIQTYLELLERHLALLRLLAREFVEGRREFMALDVDGMYRRISEQEELCRQIQRLQPAILAVQQKCAAELGLGGTGAAGSLQENRESTERVARILMEIGKARTELGRLNQIHAAYLRRSRRTANVLLNFIGTYAMTYARPVESAPPAAAALEKS